VRRVRCLPFHAAAQHARRRQNTDITGAEALRAAGKTPRRGRGSALARHIHAWSTLGHRCVGCTISAQPAPASSKPEGKLAPRANSSKVDQIILAARVVRAVPTDDEPASPALEKEGASARRDQM